MRSHLQEVGASDLICCARIAFWQRGPDLPVLPAKETDATLPCRRGSAGQIVTLSFWEDEWLLSSPKTLSRNSARSPL